MMAVMKTKIAVKGASFFAYHGFYPEERITGHVFEVDAEVWINHSKLQYDLLENTVNYEKLYSICSDEMVHSRKLIETVAYSIAEKIKNQFSNVKKGKVVIRKKGAQLGGKVDYTEIEIRF